MDKLTWYDEDGRLYCRRGYEVALTRLASYEATELMPDEIVKMGMMFEDMLSTATPGADAAPTELPSGEGKEDHTAPEEE